MPVSVPTADEFAALAATVASNTARITKLEGVTPPQPPSSSFKILPQWVANAQAKAVANDPAWAAQKALLDPALPQLLNYSDYQGAWLDWAAEFAMGHVCAVATNDAVRADSYARKAVAIALSAVRDYQKAGWVSLRYMGLGDGTKTAFPLGETPIPASVMAYTSPASYVTVTRSKAATDDVTYYSQFISVSDAQDGLNPYIQGTDWKRSGDIQENQIEWIPGGRSPAVGASYNVLTASLYGIPRVPFAYANDTVTLTSPPSATTAVFVEYVRPDYSQTSSGDGGLNSAFVDSGGYDARYLGKCVACVLDWCAGHPVLETNRAELSAMLVKWSDWLTVNGYDIGSIQSNYGVGEYFTRVCTGVVLAGTPDGDRIKAGILAYRAATVIPQLNSPQSIASLAGGFWAEGWNYGALAVHGLLLATDMLSQAGLIDSIAERTFANDVCEHLVQAGPAKGFVMGAGDFFAFPPPMPSSSYLAHYAVSALDPAKGGLLSPMGATTGWLALAMPPLPAPVLSSALPLSKFSSGTGLTVARSSWTEPAVWSYHLAGNLLNCDHQQNCAGHMEIWRNGDPLIISTPNIIGAQDVHANAQFSNTLVADDNGTGAQVYRFNPGFWYGTPGVVTLVHEDTGDVCHTVASCAASYSLNTNPGDGGSLKSWVRHWVLIRSLGGVIVYDLATSKDQTFYKDVRFHVAPGAVALNGQTFVIDRGTSRLQGTVLASVPLTAVQETATGNGQIVPRLKFLPTSPTLTVGFVSVFQTGPAGVALAPPTYWKSADGSAEGCQIGGKIVSFNLTTNALTVG